MVNDNKKMYLHSSTPYLTRSIYILLLTSQLFADDVTMTRQLWCEHVKSGIYFADKKCINRAYSNYEFPIDQFCDLYMIEFQIIHYKP